MKSDATEDFHVPVLLNEVIWAFQIMPRAWYVDATAGGGGHTAAILQRGGYVLALDHDSEAIKRLKVRFRTELAEEKLIIRDINFTDLQAAVRDTGIKDIKGVLFDLGMSTYQIKQSGRGFSFRTDEPLDMRMSAKKQLTAADIVNIYSREKLYEIFRKFGEEYLAGKIVDAVSRARAVRKISTTKELREIIAAVYKKSGVREKIDPATRTFQALRIEVNAELDNLRSSLPQAVEVLESGGRCAVISFHSLEDRIVKLFFLDRAKQEIVEILTKKPITPGKSEIEVNPAARSAKMRVAQKI